MCVCVCVCVSAPKAITQYDWLNKFYSFYMAAVVVIGSGHGLRIEVHHGN